MEDSYITMLPVVDEDGKPIGTLHIHDLIRAGIAIASLKRLKPTALLPLFGGPCDEVDDHLRESLALGLLQKMSRVLDRRMRLPLRSGH